MRGFASAAALFRYRRYARECAMQALFVAEQSSISIAAALRQAFEFYESDDVQEEIFRELMSAGEQAESVVEGEVRERFERFTRLLAEGVWADKPQLDEWLQSATRGYEFDRLAAVDRNIMRVAVWEIVNVPYIPPAVTINEAVEIAKKYSTAESGRFVNGVLGTLVRQTPKAAWDSKSAPPDPELPTNEQVFQAKAPEVEVEMVEEGTDEAKQAKRFGVWKLRAGDADVPPLTE